MTSMSGIRKKPSKRGAKAKEQKMSKKDTKEMNRVSGGLGGMWEDLHQKLQSLEAEIAADEKGLKEYDDTLAKIDREKADVQRRVNINEKWCEKYECGVGPFEKMYEGMTKDMSVLYSNAKKQHAKGIEVLKSEFNYHPSFKKPGTHQFAATPFTPK